MKTLAKKPRSHGTKKSPTCSVCHKKGHYGTKCPVLAQKLLQAVVKKSGVPNLKAAVAKQTTLTLLEAPKKNLKTLKRRSRGFAGGGKKFRATMSAKTKRGLQRKRQNKMRNADRKPRAMKTQAGGRYSHSDTKKAFDFLMKAGWLQKPCACSCGGSLTLYSPKSCNHRGEGRRFYRCLDCECLGFFP